MSCCVVIEPPAETMDTSATRSLRPLRHRHQRKSLQASASNTALAQPTSNRPNPRLRTCCDRGPSADPFEDNSNQPRVPFREPMDTCCEITVIVGDDLFSHQYRRVFGDS